MLPAFDEQETLAALRGLSWRAVLAFGAACASRLLPNYVRFREQVGWGDPAALIDLYVQEQAQMHPQASDLEARIVASPLMQQELRRQQRDLALLKHGEGEAVEGLFMRRSRESAFDLEEG